jgi:hypothetical protein
MTTTGVNAGEAKNVASFLASKEHSEKNGLNPNNIGQEALQSCAASGLGDRTTYMAATALNNQADLIAKHLGSACTNFSLDHHGGTQEQPSRADAAMQAAQTANASSESGNFNGGHEGALSSHMGQLSGLNPNEYFAKGFVESALSNYQQRRAVRNEATAMGMPADMSAKFATKEAFDNYLKSQKTNAA